MVPLFARLFFMRTDMEAGTVGLLLRRFTFRHWRQAPVQSTLLVLILALGIGVFFAMRLANRAVLAGFERFSTPLQPEGGCGVTPPPGTPPGKAFRGKRRLLR